MILLLGSASFAQDLVVHGDCPGPVDVYVAGLTPNRTYAIVTGADGGETVIPAGQPCAGTRLGVGNAQVRQVDRATATGVAHLATQAPAGLCAHQAQVLDVTTCGTSRAVPIDSAPGNPNAEATCAVPAEADLEDVSAPDAVVGNGTPASCTSQAVVDAVAQGGVITFDCGPFPVTITLDQTAKVFNDTGPRIVLDGGGLVTLSGGGARRILYMNTCDPAQVWTTPTCQNQDHPQLTVQNLTFVDADSSSDTTYDGGGAIWVRGGRFKIVNSRFLRSSCADLGPDVGGAAVRVFDQFDDLPVYVVNSTFGGSSADGGTCSNGGGVSSIGVSWTILNSLFSYNHAVGNGGNPAQAGTPGGGSGGAIYNDGNTMTLSLCGTRIERNDVIQHGSAIFFVSNDHTGDIVIDRSVITGNNGGSWYPTLPQISGHADTPIVVTNSFIQ